MTEIATDVLIVGASLAGAAAAKRTVDAGFRTIVLERKTRRDLAEADDLLKGGSES